MNIPGILYNFEVEPRTLGKLLVKWKWNSSINKIAYFQMSHSYQQANETKTIYSSFFPGNAMSSYTLRYVEPHRIYQICLAVFIRDYSLIQYRNRTDHLVVYDKPDRVSPNRICVISVPKSTHIQAVISCLIGVFVALLLIGLLIMLCQFHQRWTKKRFIKAELRGSNRNYYERHRNSETTATDDFSGFDEFETSCTSQMIAESLAWSPSSSLNSQLNFNMLKSKTSLHNHSSSHPSSTPQIMEEDLFYEAFTDKNADLSVNENQMNPSPSLNQKSLVMQTVMSLCYGTGSTSTINSNNYEFLPENNKFIQSDSTLSNNTSIGEHKKSVFNTYLHENSCSDLVLQLIDEV